MAGRLRSLPPCLFYSNRFLSLLLIWQHKWKRVARSDDSIADHLFDPSSQEFNFENSLHICTMYLQCDAVEFAFNRHRGDVSATRQRSAMDRYRVWQMSSG